MSRHGHQARGHTVSSVSSVPFGPPAELAGNENACYAAPPGHVPAEADGTHPGAAAPFSHYADGPAPTPRPAAAPSPSPTGPAPGHNPTPEQYAAQQCGTAPSGLTERQLFDVTQALPEGAPARAAAQRELAAPRNCRMGILLAADNQLAHQDTLSADTRTAAQREADRMSPADEALLARGVVDLRRPRRSCRARDPRRAGSRRLG